MRRNLDRPLRSGDKILLNKKSSFHFLEDEVYRVHFNSNTSSSLSLKCDINARQTSTQRAARRPKLTELDPGFEGIRLVLSKPLHADSENRFTQVWTVRLSSGRKAVLKIFQSCINESPTFGEYDEKMESFEPEEEQAHREAWAYRQLLPLQGDCIPHSYGFYDLTLPSGDIVYAHLMEEIVGNPLVLGIHSPCYNNHLNPYKLMESMFGIVLQIHRLGVIHNDLLQYSNTILTHSGESSQKPVIIDFGRASSTLVPSERPHPLRIERQELFLCLKGAVRSVVAFQCLEQLFVHKGHDPEWKSFMLDMDGRNLREWQPWDERKWNSAKHTDERSKEYWEDHNGKRAPAIPRWRV